MYVISTHTHHTHAHCHTSHTRAHTHARTHTHTRAHTHTHTHNLPASRHAVLGVTVLFAEDLQSDIVGPASKLPINTLI